MIRQVARRSRCPLRRAQTSPPTARPDWTTTTTPRRRVFTGCSVRTPRAARRSRSSATEARCGHHRPPPSPAAPPSRYAPAASVPHILFARISTRCERGRDPAALLGWTPDLSPQLKVTGIDRATELCRYMNIDYTRQLRYNMRWHLVSYRTMQLMSAFERTLK